MLWFLLAIASTNTRRLQGRRCSYEKLSSQALQTQQQEDASQTEDFMPIVLLLPRRCSRCLTLIEVQIDVVQHSANFRLCDFWRIWPYFVPFVVRVANHLDIVLWPFCLEELRDVKVLYRHCSGFVASQTLTKSDGTHLLA